MESIKLNRVIKGRTEENIRIEKHIASLKLHILSNRKDVPAIRRIKKLTAEKKKNNSIIDKAIVKIKIKQSRNTRT